ncbi:MAG: hypothetical protein CL760_00850 [Chloroflexi bacterium]|nr:hypothetical protein [Chloroflexota bacterium]|tara:strand:- start:25242 stop:26126 length:885 start_codon:yes stop_codon:yes gene_type:complete
MKGRLYINEMMSNEDFLNTDALYQKLLYDGLMEDFNNNEEDIFNFLKGKVKESNSYILERDKNKKLTDRIWSALIIFRINNTEEYLNTALMYAKRKDFILPAFLMLIDNADLSDSTLSKMIVLDKDSVEPILKSFMFAFENDYIDPKAYVRGYYLENENDEDTRPEAYFYTFAKEALQSKSEIEFLYFKDQDVSPCLIDKMYQNISNESYLDVICSKDFQDFLREENLNNNDFDDFSYYIRTYIDMRDGLSTQCKTNKIAEMSLKDKDNYKNNVYYLADLKDLYFTGKKTLFEL